MQAWYSTWLIWDITHKIVFEMFYMPCLAGLQKCTMQTVFPVSLAGMGMIEDIRPEQTATVFLVLADSRRIHAATFTLSNTMSSICLWTIRPSVIFSEQQRIITTCSNPSNSSEIPAQSLFYQSIIGILPPWLPLRPWCWRTPLPSEWLLTDANPPSSALQGGGQTAPAFVWSSSFHLLIYLLAL